MSQSQYRYIQDVRASSFTVRNSVRKYRFLVNTFQLLALLVFILMMTFFLPVEVKKHFFLTSSSGKVAEVQPMPMKEPVVGGEPEASQ